MANYNLRRFSHPDSLKSISGERLIQFLSPYSGFLQMRGLELPGNPSEMEGFDYAALVEVLMTPDADMPKDMIDALYYVHEMANTEGMDSLLIEAEIAGIVIEDEPEPTPIDVAVQVWLADKDIIESKHAEQFLVKARTFEYFQTEKLPGIELGDLSPEVISALESDLDDWFQGKKRGRGTRVFHYIREDGVWFLVRHGEPFKRESSIEAGKSSSVFYRPEKHDVLVYQASTGELRINAGTKGEKSLYREQFGKHLFGDEDYFPGKGKYTLDPLKADGADSLVCSDVAGIEWIKLRELQFFWGGPHKQVEIWKSDDMFSMLRDQERCIHASAHITKASFQIKFEDSKTPRTVAIRPSNIAQFQRDDDGDLIEAWLRAREFVLTVEGEGNEEDEELLVGV
ncbi:MAG: hypothetical protein ACYC4F_01495 [Armatimonadota bacterium]